MCCQLFLACVPASQNLESMGGAALPTKSGFDSQPWCLTRGQLLSSVRSAKHCHLHLMPAEGCWCLMLNRSWVGMLCLLLVSPPGRVLLYGFSAAPSASMSEMCPVPRCVGLACPLQDSAPYREAPGEPGVLVSIRKVLPGVPNLSVGTSCANTLSSMPKTHFEDADPGILAARTPAPVSELS